MLVVHNLGATDANAGPWDLQASAATLARSSATGADVRTKGGIGVKVPPGGSATWRLK